MDAPGPHGAGDPTYGRAGGSAAACCACCGIRCCSADTAWLRSTWRKYASLGPSSTAARFGGGGGTICGGACGTPPNAPLPRTVCGAEAGLVEGSAFSAANAAADAAAALAADAADRAGEPAAASPARVSGRTLFSELSQRS